MAYPDAGRDFAVPDVSRAEKRRLLRHLVPPAVIFGIVMGSIYGGLATPTESAALGVMAAFWFVWRNRRLGWYLLVNCFVQSAKTTGMVVLVIVCALLLNVTLSMTGGTQAVTRWVTGLGLSATSLLLLFVVFYVILGMFMDAMSMLVLTVPIAVPMIAALGVGVASEVEASLDGDDRAGAQGRGGGDRLGLRRAHRGPRASPPGTVFR